MKEHASKSSSRNHPSKTSKIASSCSSGVVPRLLAPVSTNPCVQSSSRRARKASTRSSLDGKWRYSVALATAARSITSSMPTPRIPWRAKSAYALSMMR